MDLAEDDHEAAEKEKPQSDVPATGIALRSRTHSPRKQSETPEETNSRKRYRSVFCVSISASQH
jgi:hypothetical protein